MATLTAYTNLNIAEANKRAGYDTMSAVLGEIQQKNDFLMQVPWYESTHGMYNKQLQATRLGSGTWSKVNGALQNISSSSDVIQEPLKMYEGDSVVDTRLIDGADDPYKVRDSEDALNLEGLMQGFTYDLFYVNNVTYPDAITSLSSRRGSLGSYCVGGSGTGSDLTSLWTFEFGPAGCYMVYNKGGTPGIKNKDMGIERVQIPGSTTAGQEMRAWVRHYEIWGAFIIRNERAMIRYANIETTGASNIFSETTFIQKVLAQLPNSGRNAVAFGNRTLVGQITSNAYNKVNATYTIDTITGFGPITRIAGVPVQMVEALVDTETALT